MRTIVRKMSSCATSARNTGRRSVVAAAAVLLLLLAGCAAPDRLAVASSTVQILGGSGTVVRVEPIDGADKVTILTAGHVVVGKKTVIVVAYQRGGWGFMKKAFAVLAGVNENKGEMGLAVLRCYLPRGFVQPVKVGNALPPFGARLFCFAYPCTSLTMTEGILGGSTTIGSIYTGGITWGSSGGGIYNDRLELVGVVQAVASSSKLPFYNLGLFVPVWKWQVENLLREQ